MEVQHGESPTKRGLSKFKGFNLLSWKHKVFEISKYKKKIKLDQSLRVPKWGVFPKRATKIQAF